MRQAILNLVMAGLICATAACAPVDGGDAHVVQQRPTASAIVLPAPEASSAPAATPEPTDTPEPTGTPEPTDTPEPDAAACDAYYADTVFVGDSLTVGFARYVRKLRRQEGFCLDGARFVAGESVSVRSVKNDRKPEQGVALYYDEEMVSVTGGIRASGKRHAVILLGTNDFGGVHLEKTLDNYRTLLDKIAARCPDVTVTVVSVPPVTRRFCERKDIGIKAWNAINPALEQLCAERGCGYVSFAEGVSDAQGYLDEAYSSDNLIHLNENGFRVWLEALRAYAAEQLYFIEANG